MESLKTTSALCTDADESRQPLEIKDGIETKLNLLKACENFQQKSNDYLQTGIFERRYNFSHFEEIFYDDFRTLSSYNSWEWNFNHTNVSENISVQHLDDEKFGKSDFENYISSPISKQLLKNESTIQSQETIERLDSQSVSQTSSLNRRLFCGRKPSKLKLTKRKDVVVKSIIRGVRSYFKREFFKFTSEDSKKYRTNSQLFMEHVWAFIMLVLKLEPHKEVIFWVGNILSSDTMQRHIKSDSESIFSAKRISEWKSISDYFTYPNEKKFNHLIEKYPYMKELILYCFTNMEGLDQSEDQQKVKELIISKILS